MLIPLATRDNHLGPCFILNAVPSFTVHLTTHVLNKTWCRLALSPDVQPHPIKTDIFGSMFVLQRGLRVWPAPDVKIKQCQKRFRDTHLTRTPFYYWNMWKGYHLSIKGIQKNYLFCQKWYIKVKAVGHLGRASLCKTLLSTFPDLTLKSIELKLWILCQHMLDTSGSEY